MTEKFFMIKRTKVTDPELLREWDQWLDDNLDPGHSDAYKERDQAVLPYVNGQPQWVCDTYMPPHLVAKLRGGS